MKQWDGEFLKYGVEVIHYFEPASVAQLDARLTGDPYVACSTPARSATSLHGDLIMKYFLQLFSSFS